MREVSLPISIFDPVNPFRIIHPDFSLVAHKWNFISYIMNLIAYPATLSFHHDAG